MNDKEKVLKLFENNNGIITRKKASINGINDKIFTRMIEDKLIERVSSGRYVDIKEIEDTYLTTQALCKKGIFSNDTALYLHGLSDRTPIKYTLTIPSGYSSRLLKNKKYKFFYVKEELHGVGVCTIKTPYGNEVEVYDVERTICDIIKNKEKLDISIVIEAIKIYVKSKNKDLSKLHVYAKLLNIDDKVSEYLEVLL